MPAAEPLARAVDRRESHLRRLRAVEHLGRVEADIAIAAGLAVVAEIAEQDAPPAGRRLGVADQRLQLAPLDALLLVRGFGLVDEASQLRRVPGPVEHPGFRRQAVAPRPARLLVIGFEALRQVEMGDEAHVRLVDAHAEGDRRHHHPVVGGDETGLPRRPLPRLQSRMVGERRDAGPVQFLRHPVDATARHAIDDAGLAPPPGEEGQQLAHALPARPDRVADVRPVEAGDEALRLLQPELAQDVGAGRLVGSCGERDPGHGREPLGQHRKLAVVRAEIVAPLADAMRLVDGEQRERRPLQQVQEARRGETLRRDIDEVEPALAHRPLDARPLAAVERRVEGRRLHPVLDERGHLVLHQRDQRRDDDRHPLPDQRRHLVAERLAGTRRHQHQRVFAPDYRVDGSALVAAERLVAEDPPEDLQRVRHLPPVFRRRQPCSAFWNSAAVRPLASAAFSSS